MNSVNVQKKDMVCSVGMTVVAKEKVKDDEASLAGKLKQPGFSKIREPIPHLRFGENIMIGAPLPPPVVKVNLMVDIEFYRMARLRLPSTQKNKSVPIKLTADSGAQVTTCNVDKLCLLGLKKKDLLSTAVGLECANKEDANVLGVFVGKVVAEDRLFFSVTTVREAIHFKYG